jgi:methyltransferase (TIGR00027 family)
VIIDDEAQAAGFVTGEPEHIAPLLGAEGDRPDRGAVYFHDQDAADPYALHGFAGELMLTNPGRVVYPVPDLPKAKAWYSELLEVAPVLDAPFAVAFRVGETSLVLSPEMDPGQHRERTGLVYWRVRDLETAYRRLIGAGAQPHSEIRTVLGSAIASVTDPFGNIIGIIGDPAGPGRRGVSLVPSETAHSVAFLRALAAQDEREEIRGKDTLAQIFLTEDRKAVLKDGKRREWVLKNGIPQGIYEYLIARTAYFDFAVQRALEKGIPQIVFLGAGYDSRPYRFQSMIQKTRLFELDSAPTQRRKLELLRQNNVSIPEQLTHVPIDFTTDALSEILIKAGFNPRQRTIFVWEGVMYYLPAEAVDAALDCIRSHAAPGSTLIFDYTFSSPEAAADPRVRVLRENMSRIHAGEPNRFRIESGGIAPFLAERGFVLVEHFTAPEMEKAFLTVQDGSLAGTIPPIFGLATAAVC